MTLTGSKHFSVDELTSKALANKHKVDNTPTPEVIENLNYLKVKLDVVRDIWGKPIPLTNSYRGEALNAVSGGVDKSSHKVGLAGDLGMPEAEYNNFINTLLKAGFKFHTLIIYPGQAFVHIDFRRKDKSLPCNILQRKFVKGGGKDYPPYDGYKK